MLEFAFALPLVLGLGLGGLETANLALAHLRVSQIAMTVADNAGRVQTSIDEADINEVFTGARIIGESIDFEDNGRIVLSSLQHNGLAGADEGQMINWQRCTGDLDPAQHPEAAPAYGVEDDGRVDDSLQGMGPTGQQIQSLPNTAVMFAEASYLYQPLVGGVLDPMIIRYESAYNVRERQEQNITNAGSIAVNSCA